MHLQHARLKAVALLTLDTFVKAYTESKKNKILTNQQIDMLEMIQMDEYTNLMIAVANLNHYIKVNSTPKKEEKYFKL